MSETQPLQFNPRSVRDRVQSLEAVHMILRNFLNPTPAQPLARTAILIKDKEGEVRDFPLTSQELLAYAERGLGDAIRRAKEQEVRLESARVKKAKTETECAELRERLRTALGNCK